MYRIVEIRLLLEFRKRRFFFQSYFVRRKKEKKNKNANNDDIFAFFFFNQISGIFLQLETDCRMMIIGV